MPSAGDARAGGAFVELWTKDNVTKAVQAIEARLTKFAAVVGIVGATLVGLGASITAPLARGLETISSWGRETTVAMRETGLSFGELDTLVDGMRASTDQLVPALAHMSSFIEEAANGSQEAARRLDQMGLSLDAVLAASQGERAIMIADGISRIADAAQRTALQRGIFGRGGLALNITGGRAGIVGRSARAEELQGDSLHSTEALAAAKSYNEAVREMGMVTKAMWASVGLAVAPVVTSVIRSITDALITVRQWIDGHRDLIAIVGASAVAIGGLGSVLLGAAAAIRIAAAGIAFMSPLLAVVKSGFGLLTILSGIWGLAVAGASLTAKVAFLAFSTAYSIGSAIVSAASAGSILGILGVVAAIGALAAAVAAGPIFVAIGGLDLLGAFAANIAEAAQGAAGSVADSFRASWNGILGDATAAMAGLGDALATGDLDTVWRLLRINAQIAWIDVKRLAMQTWTNIKYFLLDVWDQVTNGLATAWNRVDRLIRDSITGIVRGMRGVLGETIARRIGLSGPDGGAFAPTAEERRRRQMDFAERARERRDRVTNRIRELEAAGGADQDELNRLRGERDRLNVEAWIEHEWQRNRPIEGMEGAGGPHAEGQGQGSVAVTFSAAEAAGLGSGVGVQEQIRDIAQQQLAAQQQIAANIAAARGEVAGAGGLAAVPNEIANAIRDASAMRAAEAARIADLLAQIRDNQGLVMG
ncbi:MAG TPA: hypothetical protein VFE62_03010 [Gemmataceae bacterium]|nr:hypothetical protein [Gemmataceae bacterium]